MIIVMKNINKQIKILHKIYIIMSLISHKTKIKN